MKIGDVVLYRNKYIAKIRHIYGLHNKPGYEIEFIGLSRYFITIENPKYCWNVIRVSLESLKKINL